GRPLARLRTAEELRERGHDAVLGRMDEANETAPDERPSASASHPQRRPGSRAGGRRHVRRVENAARSGPRADAPISRPRPGGRMPSCEWGLSRRLAVGEDDSGDGAFRDTAGELARATRTGRDPLQSPAIPRADAASQETKHPRDDFSPGGTALSSANFAR